MWTLLCTLAGPVWLVRKYRRMQMTKEKRMSGRNGGGSGGIVIEAINLHWMASNYLSIYVLAARYDSLAYTFSLTQFTSISWRVCARPPECTATNGEWARDGHRFSCLYHIDRTNGSAVSLLSAYTRATRRIRMSCLSLSSTMANRWRRFVFVFRVICLIKIWF